MAQQATLPRPKDKPLLILIDAHALIHRAFHALPPLTIGKTGEIVGAVYGFTNTLLKAIKDLEPTHCAVAFDLPGPTFRHAKFEKYKAQRVKAPDELVNQFHRVRELVATFGIPIFEMQGYEADDVLGALSNQAEKLGVDTLILTGDTDAVQLVTPTVRALLPKGMFRESVLYDETMVRTRYGVEPCQIPHLKALKGDPSDNIPGVPGIGEKTAAKLLQRFGTIDGIYERIEEVTPPKLRELLKEQEATARQSLELTTIVRDLPIELNLEDCLLSGYDREKVLELFRELEFSSLLNRLPSEEKLKPRTPSAKVSIPEVEELASVERIYTVVDTSEALQRLVGEIRARGSFAFDTETTSLNAIQASLVGLSVSPEPGKAYYIPVGHKSGSQLPLDQVIHEFKPIFEDSSIAKKAHHGKYDMTIVGNYGIEVRNLQFDSMIAAYLLGEKSLGLKSLSFSKLGIEMTPITELIGSGAKQISMADVEVSKASDYACADADITGRLATLLEQELQKEPPLWKLFCQLEMPLVPVLLRMERNGVALDVELLHRMSMELGEQMAELEAEIYNWVGHQFNINSSQQLGDILFKELKLPHAKRTKTGYSTDASVLEGLREAHPIIEKLLGYRQITKLKSTYVDALPTLVNPQTARVHTNFNQTGTSTGRISSNDPNLQNIPVRTDLGGQIRHAFIAEGAPDWLLLAVDYSQIDLRVLAHLSGDTSLTAAFNQDEDIHAATASQIFTVPMDQVTPDMRRLAKVVNFGIIYGISGYGLAQRTDLSQEEASSFIDSYFQKYAGVKEYMESTKAQAQELGYVETLLGRRRYIPEVNSSNAQVRMAAERMAINMPVQGTAADITKIAMVNVQRRMDEAGLKSKMILQVHDELIFELPREELEEMKVLARDVMSSALELSVPLKVDLKMGSNWGEMD